MDDDATPPSRRHASGMIDCKNRFNEHILHTYVFKKHISAYNTIYVCVLLIFLIEHIEECVTKLYMFIYLVLFFQLRHHDRVC